MQTNFILSSRSVITFGHRCCRAGELSQANIKNYLDKLNQRDSNGFTPLIWASNYGQLPTCKLLLKHNVSVSSKGNHGETALLFAAANGHIHVLRLLISSGADVNQYDEVIYI